MQERTKLYLLTVLTLIGVFASAEHAPRVFAETVYQQTNSDSTITNVANTEKVIGSFNSGAGGQLFGSDSVAYTVARRVTGFCGVGEEWRIVVNASSTSYQTDHIAVFKLLNIGGTYPQTFNGYFAEWESATTTPLSASTEYFIWMNAMQCNPGTWEIYGDTGGDFYGYINTAGAITGLEERTDTHIIDFTPKDVIVNDGIDTDTPIEWELDYWFNDDDVDTYDSVIVEFANIEPIHPQLYIPDVDEINASGGSTFTGAKIVNSGHIYVIACFYNSETNYKNKCRNFEFVNGTSTVATHITQSSFEYGDDTQQDCSAYGDLTERVGCRIANFFRSAMGFLFIPSSGSISALKDSTDALLNKLPFSAVTEFSEAWDTGFASATTTSPQTLSLSFYGEEAELISTSTLIAVGGTTTAMNTLKNIITMGLWIAFGYFVFNRVSRSFLTEY